jgi:hypothetical protein
VAVLTRVRARDVDLSFKLAGLRAPLVHRVELHRRLTACALPRESETSFAAAITVNTFISLFNTDPRQTTLQTPVIVQQSKACIRFATSAGLWRVLACATVAIAGNTRVCVGVPDEAGWAGLDTV